MLIIPAIDLRGGRCVRLTQGRKDRTTVYDGDPVEIARAFADAGAEIIHVVDLDGAFAERNSPNRQIVREIASAGVDVEFGGGLRSVTDVAQVIECGVARVILGTVAVESPEVLIEVVERFGDLCAVGIDARAGQVMKRGWEAATNESASHIARGVADLGVQRIIYTDIARDGMLTGLNVPETVSVARACGVNVTASGGVGSLEHIEVLRDAGEPLIDSVIVGKALYEGRFTLAAAIAVGAAETTV